MKLPMLLQLLSRNFRSRIDFCGEVSVGDTIQTCVCWPSFDLSNPLKMRQLFARLRLFCNSPPTLRTRCVFVCIWLFCLGALSVCLQVDIRQYKDGKGDSTSIIFDTFGLALIMLSLVIDAGHVYHHLRTSSVLPQIPEERVVPAELPEALVVPTELHESFITSDEIV